MDKEWQSFITKRIFQLKAGNLHDSYLKLLIDAQKPLRLIVSNTNKGYIKNVAERVAKKFGANKIDMEEDKYGILGIKL